MIISEQEKNRIRGLHKAHSIIKEQETAVGKSSDENWKDLVNFVAVSGFGYLSRTYEMRTAAAVMVLVGDTRHMVCRVCTSSMLVRACFLCRLQSFLWF